MFLKYVHTEHLLGDSIANNFDRISIKSSSTLLISSSMSFISDKIISRDLIFSIFNNKNRNKRSCFSELN